MGWKRVSLQHLVVQGSKEVMKRKEGGGGREGGKREGGGRELEGKERRGREEEGKEGGKRTGSAGTRTR